MTSRKTHNIVLRAIGRALWFVAICLGIRWIGRKATDLGLAALKALEALAQLKLPRLHAGARAGSMILRKVRGVYGACVLGMRRWWARQVASWQTLLEERPEHGGVLLLVHFGRWLFSPRILTAAALALTFMVLKPTSVFAIGAIRYLDSIATMTTLNVVPAADAGIDRTVDLDNGKATRYLQLRLAARVDIQAVAATSIRNFGMVDALYEEMGIKEAGTKVVAADGRALMFSSEWMLSAATTLKTRITSTAVAVNDLRGNLRIWFENPRSVAPKETLFLEKQVNQKLQFFARYSTATTGAGASTIGAGRVLNAPGGSTVVITLVSIQMEQIADASLGAGELPLFRPRVDQFVFNPAAVNARTPVPIAIDTNEYLRGITVMFDSSAGIDSSQVSEFGLRGDRFEYIGQGGLVNLEDYVRSQYYSSASTDLGVWGSGALHIDLQKSGRLSNIYNPSQDTNLKLIFNVVALPAGAAILVVKHSLVRDLWTDPATGRRIVAPELPEDLRAA